MKKVKIINLIPIVNIFTYKRLKKILKVCKIQQLLVLKQKLIFHGPMELKVKTLKVKNLLDYVFGESKLP